MDKADNNANKDMLVENKKRTNKKYNYVETRKEIHRILFDFFDRELECHKNGEFDFEFMEFRTDDILRLIQNQGGSYAE